MNIIGKLMIALGVVIVIYAFNMSVALEGADVINMQLLSNRQNYIIFGSMLLLSGIVLYSTTRLKSKADKNDIVDTFAQMKKEEITVAAGNYLLKANTLYSKLYNIYLQKQRYELLIIMSIATMLISFIIPWYYYELGFVKASSMISFQPLILFILCISYPTFMLIVKRRLSFVLTIICSILSTILSVRLLYISYYYIYGSIHSSIDSTGLGPWLALVSSILYIIGALLIPKQSTVNM